MNTAELLAIHRSLLETMSSNGIKISDVGLLDIYERFVEKSKHCKRTVVAMELADEFGVTDRTIYRAVARMRKKITLPQSRDKIVSD